MKTTADFIDELKLKLELPSDGMLAKKLGIHRQYMSQYRTGKTTFSDEKALLVADLLEIDPAYVIACVHAEREKNQTIKTIWERIATNAQAMAAVLVLLVVPAVIMTGNSGEIFTLDTAAYGAGQPDNLYIMRIL